ncbi:MAG TPA: GFA family protein [Sphingobium sp.]|nr:GFA family protein [Sphingobium sp.]
MSHETALSLPQYGGCQCGALRYELSLPPLGVWACHCNQCRKQSGGAFGMSLSIPVDALRFIAGAPAVWPRQTDTGHLSDCLFCARCGTRVAHRRRAHGGRMTLKPGTLDDMSWVTPDRHVFTDTALDWMAPLIHTEG